MLCVRVVVVISSFNCWRCWLLLPLVLVYQARTCFVANNSLVLCLLCCVTCASIVVVVAVAIIINIQTDAVEST